MRRNPWHDIPLADYEGHMLLPPVGQAALLSRLFGTALDEHSPRSVALLGCAGGNGFEQAAARFEPVELMFAGRLFEHVDVDKVLANLRSLLGGGVLVAVLQLPSLDAPEVTPSPYTSLGALSGFMRLVPPDELCEAATRAGYRPRGRYGVGVVQGKRFCVQTFRG